MQRRIGHAAAKFAWLLCVSWLLIILPAPVSARPDPADLAVSSVEDTFANACAQAGPPGCAVALVLPDETPIYLGNGVTNLETMIPVDPLEPFPIGSVTKLFTAVTMLQLAADGLLDLDDPLVDYFPNLPDTTGITLRMLLNHSSGIFDYAELESRLPLPLIGLVLMQDWDPYDVASAAMQLGRYFAPGGGFHYSNSNYIILGLVIEQVTGKPLGEVYHQRIFTPLGLKETWLAGYDELPASEMRGYMLRGGGLVDFTGWENASLAWAAGGIVSTTPDLIRFALALFDGELLDDGQLAEMRTAVERPHNGGYGLGLMVVPTEFGLIEGHGGWTLAFRSGLWHMPEYGITLITLSNRADLDIWLINEALFRWALAE